MPFRPICALVLFCASVVVPYSASAQSTRGDSSASSQEVRAWLTRIHQAANTRNYLGTFVVSGGGSVSSARIAHFCVGNDQFERIETLDGQARHVLRHNDVVQTIWPGKRVALIEQLSLRTSFPALVMSGNDRITDFYEVFKQDADRVAGHEANVLLIKPKDGMRYGYRLWSDKGTGLLLRADVVGDSREVLETSAFSDLTIGVKSQPESIIQAMKRLDGYRVERPVLAPTSLESEGWVLRAEVPGFRQVSCVRRPLNFAAGTNSADVMPLLQVIYSDGLTYVSLFIEPYDGTRHTRSLMASVGATQTLMQRHRDWWITAVGDVPPATLRMFADGLERSR